MATFIVRDVRSDTLLEFSGEVPRTLEGFEGYDLGVRLRGSALMASLTAYDAFPAGWTAFFEDLALHWRGWKGDKTHESLEHNVELVASADSLGHISLQVTLRGIYPIEWTAQTSLVVEAGQLEALARSARTFFGTKSSVA